MDQPSIKMKKPSRKIESIRIWGETLSLSPYSRITYLTVSSPEIHAGNSVVSAVATLVILYLDLPASFRRCVIVGKADSNYNHQVASRTLGRPIEK